ncbi:uncharacterized protein LOC124704717 [Lolium rigidum]|uniref:uncharacterized protein LOC124704717 n=1 Tax=Lolium rigidum TaxID=89674 RepID=UPI001F5DD0A1|nr:uncharacterized protein LOC124704717 [Lolium rigidum]
MASIKITLAVDRSRNRFLFADAGSDFVDVLLSFLTLPLSAVQFCAAGASSPGCLFNLCDSVDRLRGSELLKVEACHGMLLTPSHYHECLGITCTHKTFAKNLPNQHRDGKSCKCWLVMARLVHAYEQASPRSGTFVRCKERFLITDDWTIKPASTNTIKSLIHKLSSDAVFHGFEEVEVCVSWEKVVSMLKASLSSDTVFADVFLPMGIDDQDAPVNVKPASVDQNIKLTSGSLSQSKIKLFYDRQEKKVMYAECKHDFVDLLLGFLTYPVGSLIKNMTDGAAISHLGSSRFKNLYTSAVDLNAAGFITEGNRKKALLNPPLSPLSQRRECFTLKEGDQQPENYMGLLPYSSCDDCCHDLVEDRRYVVDDDLLIHQASAMSVAKHWCRREKANVMDMDITMGKHEAVVLLQAMLTSKTVLTDVFIDRLEAVLPPEEPQGVRP